MMACGALNAERPSLFSSFKGGGVLVVCLRSVFTLLEDSDKVKDEIDEEARTGNNKVVKRGWIKSIMKYLSLY